MDTHTETLKLIAADNTWETIFPELSLGLLALLILIMEILPKRSNDSIPNRAIAGQAFILFIVIVHLGMRIVHSWTDLTTFSGMLVHSHSGDVMRIFFLLCSTLVCYLGNIDFKRRGLPRVEFFHIVMVVTAGLMLLAQSNHFVMFFVALETVTVGFYILVSYNRRSVFSLEAGLKYLILGAFSSSILLFGIVLLYGAAGNPMLASHADDPMNFSQLGVFIAANPNNLLVLVGSVLVIAGIAFKIGAVPFQIWVPDVYQGAPTPVTAFLAVASKAGGFFILINLIRGPFAPLADVLVPLLSAIAVVTILFGNLAALSQRNVKRLMGLSGISHAGYLLIGVVAAFQIEWAANAVIFYLFTYLFASMGVFAVMILLSPDEDSAQELEDYGELAKNDPFLGMILVVGLGSLAGIPPLAGFIGKLLIFIAAFQAQLYGLLAVAVVGVVMSIYYYFGWIMEAVWRKLPYPATGYDEPATPQRRKVSRGLCIVMGCLTALTLLLGFYQGILSYLLF